MENKKPDMRDGKHTKIAGDDDSKGPMVPAPKTGEHILTPGPSSHTPDGQSTKSS